MRLNFGRFRGCYRSWLRTHPGQSLRAPLRFRIGPDGDTRTIVVQGLEGTELGRCLHDALADVHFSTPPQGDPERPTAIVVVYPLVLQPGVGSPKPREYDWSRAVRAPRWWRAAFAQGGSDR